MLSARLDRNPPVWWEIAFTFEAAIGASDTKRFRIVLNDVSRRPALHRNEPEGQTGFRMYDAKEQGLSGGWTREIYLRTTLHPSISTRFAHPNAVSAC